MRPVIDHSILRVLLPFVVFQTDGLHGLPASPILLALLGGEHELCGGINCDVRCSVAMPLSAELVIDNTVLCKTQPSHSRFVLSVEVCSNKQCCKASNIEQCGTKIRCSVKKQQRHWGCRGKKSHVFSTRRLTKLLVAVLSINMKRKRSLISHHFCESRSSHQSPRQKRPSLTWPWHGNGLWFGISVAARRMRVHAHEFGLLDLACSVSKTAARFSCGAL